MTLLDMVDVTARQASWRFELVDKNLQTIEKLEVDRGNPPTVETDVSRAVKRSLKSVRLTPGAIDRVDVIKHRLRATMITHDGQQWPQGVFLFSDVSRLVMTSGLPFDIGSVELLDQGLIVDQQLRNSVSVGPGANITTAITDLLAPLPITFTVQPSGAVVSTAPEALAWAAGTSRLRVVNDLAKMIGYHELFFDNDGIGRLAPMPNPAATPDADVISYPVGRRTFRASTMRSTNILELPNRFVVVGNGINDTPVFGAYDIPASAPHSVANREFEIARVEQIQGIASTVDADIAAQAIARNWRYPFETVEFHGPPDPRHDHYDTIEFEGVRFLELRWSMQLSEGAPMVHSIRRTYES
jgi:hypothetical protein